MTILDVPFGLIMLVGKYVFLALVYGFLYWAFRGLFAQTALEAKSHRPAVAAQPPTVSAPMAPSAPVVPPVAQPVYTPQPEPVYVPEPEPVYEVPSAFELATEPVVEHVVARKPALVVEDQGQSSLRPGETIDLTAAVTIGRAEDNALVITDKFCSTHHALIFLKSGQRILRDRNSTNGTFHNGRRVTEDVLLADGDTLGMGTAVFRYEAGES
ncbi:MAG: FHA domain-containing protein [Armatimonadota bacterium]